MRKVTLFEVVDIEEAIGTERRRGLRVIEGFLTLEEMTQFAELYANEVEDCEVADHFHWHDTGEPPLWVFETAVDGEDCNIEFEFRHLELLTLDDFMTFLARANMVDG